MRVLVLIALALSLALAAADQVTQLEVGAAPPSKGCSGCTLAVIPNPVPVGTNITIVGSGYGPYESVLLNTAHLPSPQVTADAGGSFSYIYDYKYGPGQARVEAYVFQNSGWVLVAAANFTVVASADSDGDGFFDSDETYFGTNSFDACSNTSGPDDEAVDAWPPDFNDDQKVDTWDFSHILGFVGKVPGSAGYSTRLDLVADDRDVIDTGEVSLILGYLTEICQT